MKLKTFYLLVSCSIMLGSNLYAAGKQVTVGADETVYGIAHEHGIRTQALIQANNLKPPYTLKKGQVLRIPGSNEHVVRNGENLHSIADDYGVNPDVLAHENDIQAPFYVKDGDSLFIPTPDTESMAEVLKEPTHEIAVSSLEPLPLVKSEPTPHQRPAAAHTHADNSLPDDLAQELAQEKGIKKNSNGVIAGVASQGTEVIVDNSIDQPALMGNLAEGKNAKPKKVSPSTAVPVNPSSKNDQQKEVKPKIVDVKKETKKEDIKTVKQDNKNTDKKETKKEEKAEKVEKTAFARPVDGKVIAQFKAGVNDGINFAVPEGTAVKAAATGEVIYAGSELKGLGELLLLKHKDGWMTAYAHNSKLLVKKGDTVKQGQTIAKSGKTGDVKSPQLHFEVRKGKQPVDPLPKLGS